LTLLVAVGLTISGRWKQSGVEASWNIWQVWTYREGKWSYLDMTALGRQEEWEDSPDGYPQTPPYQWWNYHDAYGKDAA
jgi:hypothetical protein